MNSADATPDSITLQLYRFLECEIAPDTFLAWVYVTPELEPRFAVDAYLTLLEFDLRHRNQRELFALVASQIDLLGYGNWALRRHLQVVVEGGPAVAESIMRFYDLYCQGYGFLATLALERALWLVCPPQSFNADDWVDLTPEQQNALVAACFPGIVDEARAVLGWLDRGEILLVPPDLRYDRPGLGYIDNRPDRGG